MKRIIALLDIALGLYVVANDSLGNVFFVKLKAISEKHGMNPADLLLVMYSESGVNPNAMNKDGGAAGIGQFMPYILKNLGWSGTPQQFTQLPAEDQLDYMDKFISSNIKMNGGKPFESATQYYQSHFLPASLSRGTSLDTIIADGRPGMAQKTWEKPAYDHNTSFDQDKKGYITVGDLDKWVNKKRQESGYQQLLSKLNAATNESFEPSNKNEQEIDAPSNNDAVQYLNNFMDSIEQSLSVAASVEYACSVYKNYCLKGNK